MHRIYKGEVWWLIMRKGQPSSEWERLVESPEAVQAWFLRRMATFSRSSRSQLEVFAYHPNTIRTFPNSPDLGL